MLWEVTSLSLALASSFQTSELQYHPVVNYFKIRGQSVGLCSRHDVWLAAFRLVSPSASMEAPADPTSNMGEHLVRCYGNLYAAARVDALDSLDNLPALKDADELKSKILFSVVVVSRPAVTHLLASSGFCFSIFPGWLAYVVISALCFCPNEILVLRNTFLSSVSFCTCMHSCWGILCE